MKKPSTCAAILIITVFISYFGVVPLSEAAYWDSPSIRHNTGRPAASPHLLKLQDGRTMLTWLENLYGNGKYIFYQISTNGIWSPPIRIPWTYEGYDPTVTQNPVTGEIIVAYAKYIGSATQARSSWHAAIYITRISPAYLAYYVDYEEGCGEYYAVEPYNAYWSSPQQVVISNGCIDYNFWGLIVSGCDGLEYLDGYWGIADDYVPSIFAVQAAGTVKLLIVYTHGWEPGKYGSEKQTAQLRVVESWNGGSTWSAPRAVFNSPNSNYYDSKPSCTDFGYGSYEVLCSFFIRDRATTSGGISGYSGIYTIRSYDWGVTWYSPTQILPINSYENKWPFVLKDGSEIYLAYTTKNGSYESDFIIKWFVSTNNGYSWLDYGKISDQYGVQESWPALARRYDYSPLRYGVTAVWDNHWGEMPGYNSHVYNIYYSNLRGVNIVSPNGWDTWTVGEWRTIVWNNSFASDYAAIYITRDGGSTWQYINSYTYNTGSYQWGVTSPPCSQCRIGVYDWTNFDQSDYPFSIVEYYYDDGG